MSSPAGDLKVAMKPRHLVMMSLGSAIGAGVFVGSGDNRRRGAALNAVQIAELLV